MERPVLSPIVDYFVTLFANYTVRDTLALISSFIAIVFVVMSYFVRKKSFYLLYQFLCIIFLILSYFFNAQYFAMIGVFIGLCRTGTFFLYEKRGARAPIAWSFVFGVSTVAAYFVVNFLILKEGKPLDILCMMALVLYAFIFRIRNLKIVRYSMLAPTVLSITFNILTGAKIFVTLAYVFEMAANLVAIVKYDILGRKSAKAAPDLPPETPAPPETPDEPITKTK